MDHKLIRGRYLPYLCQRKWSSCFYVAIQNTHTSQKIDTSKGYKGITCFIATKDMGIKIAKKEQKLGIRASSTCTLNFDDLKIPAENVIGSEGKGYKIAIEVLNEGE